MTLPPVAAATLCLLRAGPDGPQVLMVRRSGSVSFMGDAYVFPGGAVEDADRLAPVVGAASEELVPWLAAALRETAEEAGVWLTRPAIGESARSRLVGLRGERLVQRLSEEGLAFDATGVALLSNWVTPEGVPRRFDTRFFVAEAPPDTEATADGDEVSLAAWVRPDEALARGEAGEWVVLPPTRHHLRLLAGFAVPAEAVAYAARQVAVEVVQPRLVSDGRGGLLVLLPGEPGYAEAAQASVVVDDPVASLGGPERRGGS